MKKEQLDRLKDFIDDYRECISSTTQLLDDMSNQLKKGLFVTKNNNEKIISSLDDLLSRYDMIVEIFQQLINNKAEFSSLADLESALVEVEQEFAFEKKLAKYKDFIRLDSENAEAKRFLLVEQSKLNRTLKTCSNEKRIDESLEKYKEFYDLVVSINNNSMDMMSKMNAITNLSNGFPKELVGHAIFNMNIFLSKKENSVDNYQDRHEKLIYDKNGYDQYGYDTFGFDRDSYDKDGFDPWGYDSEGYDVLGYDQYGYDRYDRSKDGFLKSDYKDDGFHYKTGYNPFGYDKNGFNKDGIDQEGYDKNGYDIFGYDRDGYDESGFNYLGYDKLGYNRTGYDQTGYNREGFNKEGYNKSGFDRTGYNKDGFNIYGYNIDGYDKNGYNKNGYNIDGYDKDGNRNPDELSLINNSGSFELEDKLERQYFDKCVPHIRAEFATRIKKMYMDKVQPLRDDDWVYVYDRNGFLIKRQSVCSNGAYDTYIKQSESAQKNAESIINQTLDQPYFSHINEENDPELYIGKKAIYGWVTDWADPRARVFYNRDKYNGKESQNLNYIRDIIIHDRKYIKFETLYDSTSSVSDDGDLIVADSHLIQIIEGNRKNKKIHDIITSIQKKQYDIISADKEKNYLIMGCAGSGKTMILLHRIRFMKYNDPDMNMSDIIILSPTDILGKESWELSKLLQIEETSQFNTSSFYNYVLHTYFEMNKINYFPFEVVDEKNPNVALLLESGKKGQNLVR